MENEREELFDAAQEAAEDTVKDNNAMESAAPVEEEAAAQPACAPEKAADTDSTGNACTAAEPAASDTVEQKPKKKNNCY